jgi:hypothetical protein
MTALLHSLEPLVEALWAGGYTVVGPCEHDGAIVLDVIAPPLSCPPAGASRRARHLPPAPSCGLGGA